MRHSKTIQAACLATEAAAHHGASSPHLELSTVLTSQSSTQALSTRPRAFTAAVAAFLLDI
jgi:hypothetical protein